MFRTVQTIESGLLLIIESEDNNMAHFVVENKYSIITMDAITLYETVIWLERGEQHTLFKNSDALEFFIFTDSAAKRTYAIKRSNYVVDLSEKDLRMIKSSLRLHAEERGFFKDLLRISPPPVLDYFQENSPNSTSYPTLNYSPNSPNSTSYPTLNYSPNSPNSTSYPTLNSTIGYDEYNCSEEFSSFNFSHV